MEIFLIIISETMSILFILCAWWWGGGKQLNKFLSQVKNNLKQQSCFTKENISLAKFMHFSTDTFSSDGSRAATSILFHLAQHQQSNKLFLTCKQLLFFFQAQVRIIKKKKEIDVGFFKLDCMIKEETTEITLIINYKIRFSNFSLSSQRIYL